MAKVLLFFTSSYPFGTGETFIENEIEYLAEAFDKIVIVSNDTTNEQTRQIPPNVSALRLDYELTHPQKLASFFQLINPIFWKEFKIIRNTYKQNITLPVLNTMLQTLQKATIFCPFINKTLKENTQKEDQIYLYSYWNNDMAFSIAAFKVKKTMVKAFSRMHRWDVYFEENKINYLPFRNYIFTNLDKVYSISEDGLRYTQNKLGGRINTLSISRLGVKKQITLNPTDSEKLQLLSTSNLIPVKAVDLLIQALALLNIEFYWTHIGDGLLRKELEGLATEKIAGKFEFKGNLSNQEVMEYLRNHTVDLFINVSLSEGIPVSIMEAMSFGIPCFAKDVGGNSEIVDNQNGKLLSTNATAEKITEDITQFYSLTIENKKQKRKGAYETWENNYNAEKNYIEFIDKITNL